MCFAGSDRLTAFILNVFYFTCVTVEPQMLYLITRDSAVTGGVQTCMYVIIVSPAKSTLSGVIMQKWYRKQSIAPRLA